jgi:hypothetical protein
MEEDAFSSSSSSGVTSFSVLEILAVSWALSPDEDEYLSELPDSLS